MSKIQPDVECICPVNQGIPRLDPECDVHGVSVSANPTEDEEPTDEDLEARDIEGSSIANGD